MPGYNILLRLTVPAAAIARKCTHLSLSSCVRKLGTNGPPLVSMQFAKNVHNEKH